MLQKNISEADFKTYKEVYAEFTDYKPDCIIYLDAPLKKQVDRIVKRDRHGENKYDETYLHSLNDIYLKILKEEFDAPNKKISILDWSTHVPINDGILNSDTTLSVISQIIKSI